MMTPQTMGEIFDQVEAEMLAMYKNATPEQLAAEEERRQTQRDHEAKHTIIETEEDRQNLDEYPEENEE
jgi:hypothetical protein